MASPATEKGFDPSELDFEQSEELKDFPASPAASGSLNKPAFKIGAMTFNRKLVVGLSIFLVVAGVYSLLNGLSSPVPKKGASTDEKKAAAPPAENYVRPPDMVNETPGSYRELAKKAAEGAGQGQPGQPAPSMGVPAVPAGGGNIFVQPAADPRYPQYTPGEGQPGGNGNAARQSSQVDANDAAAERRRAMEQRRQDAIEKRRQTVVNARKSGILFKFANSFSGSSASAADMPGGVGGTPPSMIDPSSVLKQFSGILSQGASSAPAPAATAATGSGTRDVTDSRLLYMQQQRTTPATAQIQEPASPYELKSGTIIPAIILTGINSDLPGHITAKVRENVYDTVTGRHLLVPMGATLNGDYDSKIMWGQSRLLVVWTRIVFPNGSSIDLGNLPGVDMRGQAGLSDQVDNHWGRILSSVVMSTAMAAGTKVAVGQPSSTETTQTPGQLAASGASESLVQSGQQLFARNLQINPTLIIRQGQRFNIMVHHDIVLRPYRR